VWGSPFVETDFPNNLVLVAISCADASDCTAVGQESLGGFSSVGVVVTDSDGGWSSTPLQIAGTYTLNGVSCPDAVDCTAVGHDDPVEGPNPTYYPVYVIESSGSWGSGTEIDTTGEGVFNAVSCVDASDCAAVGDDGQDIYAVESEGIWGPDIEASSDIFDTNSGFTDVSCTGAVDCTAVEFLGPTSTSNTPSVVVTSNAPVYNQTLTFIATVTGSNASKPKASVTWSVSDPQTVSCSTTTGPINSGNVATYSCSVRHVNDGTYSATAQFNGDKNYAAAISEPHGVTVTGGPPGISSFSPLSGPIASKVTINGTYLANAKTVTVHGTIATILSDSAMQIKIRVSPGTTTGPIKVKTPSGTVTSSTPFTIT
jgi:Bacterial Ig-like domain (group 3)